MRRLLVAALPALALAAPADAQTFTVFHDPNDTGTSAAVANIPIGGPPVWINVWFTAGNTPQPDPNDACTGGPPGQEVCGVDFLIVGTGGVTFVQPATFQTTGDFVVNNTSFTQLQGNGGDALIGTVGPARFGRFQVVAVSSGNLEVTGKKYVNSSLVLGDVPATMIGLAGAPDFDSDGTADQSDACPTLANSGDADADGVDNACDSCRNVPNPRITGDPPAGHTRTSGQPDGDGDGRGNACDFDYNGTDGLGLVTVAEVNSAKANLGKSLSLTTCSNGPNCSEFDHIQESPVPLSIVTVAEVNLAKSKLGKLLDPALNPEVATCGAPCAPPFSNTLGVGATLGRVICQGPACTY